MQDDAAGNLATYKVILTGLRSDMPSSDARNKLAALFKTTPDQIDKLIVGSFYVLKKSLTAEIAAKYKAAIEAAGGTCRVEAEERLESAPAQVVHPSIATPTAPTTTSDTSTPAATSDTTTPPASASIGISSGSATHAQQVRQVAPNEVLIYLPIEIALVHASAAVEQLGTIKQLDKSQQCIDGLIRYGMQAVEIRVSLVAKQENETTATIQFPSGNGLSTGEKSAAKRLVETLINLDKPGYKSDRFGMHPAVLAGVPLILAGVLAAAAYFLVPSWFQSPTPSAVPKNSLQPANAEPKILYRFWQSKYVPEPGAYEDEMVSGKVLYECKIGGNYPAYFGYLIIRQTLMIQPNPDAKPFPVYIAGIDYGDRLRHMTQTPETGGKGAIEFLRTQGCEIPPGLEAEARAAIPQPVVAK